MKKTLLLTVILLTGLYSVAQQISLTDNIIIDIPSDAQKLDKDQLVSFANQNQYDVRAISINPKNVYDIRNILVALYTFKGDLRKNNIDFKETNINQTKSDLDASHKRFHNLSNYSSIIKPINNNSVLITKDLYKGNVIYRFSYVNKENTLILNGLIQCQKDDEKNADVLLDNLINSIKFTE